MLKNQIEKFVESIKKHKLIVLYSLSVIYIFILSIMVADPYPAGDGLEYVLTTEAIYNHGTPDIQTSDIESYIKEAKKYKNWQDQGKFEYFDRLQNELVPDKNNYRCDIVGFSKSKDSSYFSIHFFSYPLFVAPFKFLFKPFNIHPIRYFYIANAFLILGVVFFILFYFPFKDWVKISIAGLFYFSTVQWYLLWTHPEVFVACLTFIGVFLYFFKRIHWGIFICSIAATQYLPLSVLILVMVLEQLIRNKFSVISFVYLGFSSFIIVLPSLFFYYHFEVTNLVSYLGYLDTKYITENRITGFFIDLNQGLILSFPLLLFVYAGFIVFSLFKRIKNKDFKISFFEFIPLVIFIMLLIVTTMGNWNHGQSISNRYAIYVGTVLFCHFIYLFIKFQDVKWVKPLVIITLLTQITVITMFGGFKPSLWSSDVHKDIAKWTLNEYPEKYNPDPWIFLIRTEGYHHEEHYYKGIAYLNKEKEFRKAIVNINHLDKVSFKNLNQTQVKKLVEGKSDQYGWVYFHTSDLEMVLNKTDLELFMKQFKN